MTPVFIIKAGASDDIIVISQTSASVRNSTAEASSSKTASEKASSSKTEATSSKTEASSSKTAGEKASSSATTGDKASSSTKPSTVHLYVVRRDKLDNGHFFFEDIPSRARVQEIIKAFCTTRHSDWKLWDLKFEGVPVNPSETIERFITGDYLQMVVEPKPYVAAKAEISIYTPKPELEIWITVTFSPEWKFVSAYPEFVPGKDPQQRFALQWPIITNTHPGTTVEGHGIYLPPDGEWQTFSSLFWEARKLPSDQAPQLDANKENESVFGTLDVSLTPDNAVVVDTNLFFAATDCIMRRFAINSPDRTAFHLHWQKEVKAILTKRQEFIALRVLHMSDYSKSVEVEVLQSEGAPFKAPHAIFRLFFVFGGVPQGATEWKALTDNARGKHAGFVGAGGDWLDKIGLNLDEWNDKEKLRILELGGIEVPVYPAKQEPTKSESGKARETEPVSDGDQAASLEDLLNKMKIMIPK